MTSLRTEPRYPGICSASRACVRRPNDAPCDACARSCLSSPRQFAGCAAYGRAKPPRRGPWGYRTPCPDTDVAAHAPSPWAVRRRSRRSFAPTVCSRECWLRPQPRPVVRQRPRRSRCVSCPVCRDPWGSGRFDPPKTRLAHGAVGTLPLPVHGPEFLAVFEQHGPQKLENSPGDPSLHRSMNRRVVAESSRQLVPLHAAAHPIDDTVDRCALPGSRPSGPGWRVQFVEDGLNNVPQFVAHFPNCGKHLNLLLLPGHPWLLSWPVRWLSAKNTLLR